MKQDINTIEGALHKLNINFSGNVDFADYTVYGSCAPYGCCHCEHFEVAAKTENGCQMIIPALKCGIYKYQLFIKQISTNQESLILSGDITVKDRLCDCASGTVNDSATTVVDATISADTVEVNVTMEKGPQGDPGPEGPMGPEGPQGPAGESGGIDWAVTKSRTEELPVVSDSVINGIAIGYNSTLQSSGVTIGYGSSNGNGVTIGTRSKANYGVAIGTDVNSNLGEADIDNVAIGNISSAGYKAVAIGQSAYSPKEGDIAIGNNAKTSANTNFGGAIVIGNNAKGSTRSIIIGKDATTDENAGYAVVIGYGASNFGNYDIALGSNSYTNGWASIAIGKDSNADGEGAIAIGNGAIAGQNEITLKAGDTEVKFNQDGATLNGNPIGGGSSEGGSSFNWGDYFNYEKKYKDCTSTSALSSVNSNWRNDLDANGAWNYNLENFSQSSPNFKNWNAANGYSDLKSFNSYFGNNMNYMSYSFQNCTELESWNCATPRVYDMDYAFTGCRKLKHFRGDLSELSSADNMFGSSESDCCQLDLASVQHIAQTLPTMERHAFISLGIAGSLNGNSDLETALQQIRDKGWEVYTYYNWEA